METDIPKTIILKVERAVFPTAKYRIILTLTLLCICFIAGCSSNIDKQKFREIKSAVRAIDEAVGDTTLSYDQFDGLLGKLTEELSKAAVAVSTKEETALLKSYEELLTTYQDSAILWEYKIESSQYEWIPTGNIYVDAKVRTITEKYNLLTEPRVIELTNHHFESISDDSIRVIWSKAHEQLNKI